MKKWLALILTVVMLGTLAVSAGAEIDASVFEWEAPAETVKITYYDGQELPESCAKKQELMHDFLLKYFNIDLVRIVYENDIEERLGRYAQQDTP